ncbi:MAG: aminotransferase class III-fold pyridoxal phosphate-dependent enzyme [Gemmataceae bacterium]|nr:aminotransferase class III-fold pyridoxal phosphate-dependent enzyme [Gemmataceae bacterium]
MASRALLVETCERLLREQTPNLFRLYLNPYVVQTCLCLERYAQTTWPAPHPQPLSPEGRGESRSSPYQTFLANGFDEALSGAIKLARYCARVSGKPAAGLIIDAAGRLGPFASATARGEMVSFLPGIAVVRKPGEAPLGAMFGFVVLASGGDMHSDAARRLVETGALLIRCVDRASLDEARALPSRSEAIAPDIVVFDESFVHHDVPFGAFTARQALFDHWNHSGKSTFHSTTFQPNAISTLHFMRCLERDDPQFHAGLEADLRRIITDLDVRMELFRRLYSPSLAGAIRMTGFDTPDVRAAGEFVMVNGRRVLDTVGGVACSVRGHNPPAYADELEALADVDCEAEVAARLRELTGLATVLPAVSGASAVENALKIALVAQFPRRHVLALKSGFGGKTLFALTGTWNSAYKENIDPLYAEVSYVDPFAADAVAQIDTVLRRTPVAVVQMELVQGVGGVRRVPEAVIRHLDACRAEHDYLLLIDEVQTGMYRTGPFTLSRALGVTPDLLIVGKAVSDMMFPFALTLCSAKVGLLLEGAGSTLPEEIRRRCGYEFGYKTALNALRFAETTRLADRVAESGKLFDRLLREELASCKAVREVRVFGLLIGIELDASRRPQRWFAKRLYQIYLSALLRHPRFPVLVGFCQYEPNVLKITPPLTMQPDDIRKMCATIGETLRRPFFGLLASAAGGLLSSRLWRKNHGRPDPSCSEPDPGSHGERRETVVKTHAAVDR